MTETVRSIIIGGPGRSGTSYVAAALGRHPGIASFKDIELKFLFERDGLADLGWILCETFSPNRASVALARFRGLLNQLRNGGYDQPLLEEANVDQALRRFYDAVAPDGIGRPMDRAAYCIAAQGFFADIAKLALQAKPEATRFLEKTPHNLLSPESISDFTGKSYCLHIIRDPRGTALSLLSQSWGPDTLAKSMAWVQSYYDQWLVVRNRYASLGLMLDEMRIEDIVRFPTDHGNRLLTALNLEVTDVFADANGNHLSRGQDTLDQADRMILDDGLGALARRLGYPEPWADR